MNKETAMRDAFPRYAVYYAPARDEALWTLGCAWLGRDAENGKATPPPAVQGCSAAALADLTDSPRRYGLHATIKAPIHLASGHAEGEFLDAVADWAFAEPRFELPGVTVGTLGGFLALLPTEPCKPLHDMAERCVRVLDAFRAPPSPAELARRRVEALSDVERQHLADWGYPYVLDRYRFHITLTERIDDPARHADVLAAARDWFSRIVARPLPVNEACVFAQARPNAPFMLIKRFSFSG
jgi:putative phosphonate metabolism protein